MFIIVVVCANQRYDQLIKQQLIITTIGGVMKMNRFKIKLELNTNFVMMLMNRSLRMNVNVRDIFKLVNINRSSSSFSHQIVSVD